MTAKPTLGPIVVVEDPFISTFLRNVLQRKGYQVIPADPSRCATLLRSGEAGVALLITNVPGVFAEFADRVPLLYLAAFPDPDVASHFRANRVLRKPFHTDQLLHCVEQLMTSM